VNVTNQINSIYIYRIVSLEEKYIDKHKVRDDLKTIIYESSKLKTYTVRPPYNHSSVPLKLVIK
jgi:hypothetical protein